MKSCVAANGLDHRRKCRYGHEDLQVVSLEENHHRGRDSRAYQAGQKPGHSHAGRMEYRYVVQFVGVGAGHRVKVFRGFFLGDFDDTVGSNSADGFVVSVENGHNNQVILAEDVSDFFLVCIDIDINRVGVY